MSTIEFIKFLIRIKYKTKSLVYLVISIGVEVGWLEVVSSFVIGMGDVVIAAGDFFNGTLFGMTGAVVLIADESLLPSLVL